MLARWGEVEGALRMCIYIETLGLLAQAVSKIKILLSSLRMTMPTALSFFRSFQARPSLSHPRRSRVDPDGELRWLREGELIQKSTRFPLKLIISGRFDQILVVRTSFQSIAF